MYTGCIKEKSKFITKKNYLQELFTKNWRNIKLMFFYKCSIWEGWSIQTINFYDNFDQNDFYRDKLIKLTFAIINWLNLITTNYFYSGINHLFLYIKF